MKKTIALGLIGIMFLSTSVTPAIAGIQSDMENFFNGMGMSNNITQAGRYNTQAGGYVTGGGMFVRTPVRNYQLASITLPSIHFGCGGIDAYLGGFSFINVKQFTGMLRNIGNNALGYAFELALQTVSPDIKGVIDDLKAAANFINNANISSCHGVQRLAQGVKGLLDSSSASGCASAAVANGQAVDQQGGIEYCKSPIHRFGMMTTGLTAGQKHDQHVNKNLMWSGLMDQDANIPQPIGEMLMSLTGTFVNTVDKGGKAKAKWNPPTGITPKDFINGGTFDIYRCGLDYSDCMPPLVNNGKLARTRVKIKGLKPMVSAALDNIYSGLVNEKYRSTPFVLNPNSLKLIGISKLPILAMLAKAVAISPELGTEVRNEMVAPVAYGIATEYLSWAFNVASRAAISGFTNIDQAQATVFMNDVRSISQAFNVAAANVKMRKASEIIQRAKWLDSLLVANMTPHFQKVFNFERGS